MSAPAISKVQASRGRGPSRSAAMFVIRLPNASRKTPRPSGPSRPRRLEAVMVTTFSGGAEFGGVAAPQQVRAAGARMSRPWKVVETNCALIIGLAISQMPAGVAAENVAEQAVIGEHEPLVGNRAAIGGGRCPPPGR